MAGFNDGGDEEVISEINIVPFVDIVLVLLIIFMVTSTAIVRAAIKVDLPSAASAGDSVETTLNLVFTKERELLLDGRPLSRAEVAAIVKGEVEGNPKVQAVISADQIIPYGEVVEVIDLVKENGVKTFALNIERKTK